MTKSPIQHIPRYWALLDTFCFLRDPLAALLRRYDFELMPDQIVEPQPLITLRPKNRIWMKWDSTLIFRMIMIVLRS